MRGGHPILPEGANQHRVNEALRPLKISILLMPSPNIKESLRFLRRRQKLEDGDEDLNELYFQDNTFFEIAKFVVYVTNKPPEEIVHEIQNYA